jgi:hypothetical protein
MLMLYPYKLYYKVTRQRKRKLESICSTKNYLSCQYSTSKIKNKFYWYTYSFSTMNGNEKFNSNSIE